MVGAQTSTGCRDCRLRKRKCDEERPRCGLCMRRDIVCVYGGIKFIAVDPSRRERTIHLSTQAQNFVANPVSHGFAASSQVGLTPQSLLASSFYAQMYGAYIEKYVPSRRGCSERSQDPVASSWIILAYDQAHTDSLLADSLAALSLAFHERQNELSEYGLGSRVLYARAVNALSRRLQLQEQVIADSTLAATLLLGLFEVQSRNTGLVDWFRHTNGVAAILQLRGQSNIGTEFGRQLYLGSRTLNLLSGMGKRKALGPSEPTFHHAFAGSQSSYARLFEILNTVPGVLEIGDQVEAAINTGKGLQVAVSMYKSASEELRTRLGVWRAQLTIDESETFYKPLFWDEPSLLCQSTLLNDLAATSRSRLCFRNPDIAQQLVIYWACLLLVDGWMPVMHRRMLQSGVPLNVYQMDAEQKHVYTRCNALAADITKSMEYFISADMGLANSEFIGLPMTVAASWYKHSNPDATELKWMEIILTQMRAMNAGLSDMMRLLATKGGGGPKYRELIGQKSPSTW